MEKIIVHLTLTGILILQSSEDFAHRWRIIVPDLANSHHAAFMLADSNYVVAVPPLPPNEIALFPMAGQIGKIDGILASGSSDFPQELITLAEACDRPPDRCVEVPLRSKQPRPPALELWVEEAGLEATFIDPNIEWRLERMRNGQPESKLKGFVTEEMCLTFKVAKNLVVNFKDGKGERRSIELRPNGQNVIELRLANIPPPSSKEEKLSDAHFRHYYDMTGGYSPSDVAEPKGTAKGTELAAIQRHPEHALSLITKGVVQPGWPLQVPNPLTAASKGGTNVILSPTGANCPPVGDPYP